MGGFARLPQDNERALAGRREAGVIGQKGLVYGVMRGRSLGWWGEMSIGGWSGSIFWFCQ